jgi:hypothetical protein
MNKILISTSLDKNFITAWKSITKLVTFQSFVAKCCKMRITKPCEVCRFSVILYYAREIDTAFRKNGKLRRAILSAFYNISQRNFGILLILWCSFKLWWNFCLDLSRSKFCSLGNRSNIGLAQWRAFVRNIEVMLVLFRWLYPSQSADILKPRTDGQVFLDKFSLTSFPWQVFLDKFSLTSFPWQVFLDKFYLLVCMAKNWQVFLAKEPCFAKLVMPAFQQGKLLVCTAVKENLTRKCAVGNYALYNAGS